MENKEELEYKELLEKYQILQSEEKVLKENLALLEDLRIRLGTLSERMMMVGQINKELNTLDMDKISSIVVEKIPQLIGAKYCSLFLYEHQSDELILKDHNHPEQINERIAIKHHENTIMGLALRRKEIIHIVDIDEYERVNNIKLERTFADKYATKTCISIPLLMNEYLIGVLNFADKLDGTYFDEVNDLPIIEQLNHTIAMALRNCLLFQEIQTQARIDPLTGLANYRYFHEELQREMHRSLRYERPLTLLMADIDNFKSINDTYGHRCGDYVLAGLGRIFRERLRREDIPARYGGEEFVIILPETEIAGAISLARRLLRLVRNAKFSYEGTTLKVTISIGIAQFKPAMGIEDFVKAADRALYQAKLSGKDKCEVCAE
jgi:diguanylate cyclase (GGDEF)-like protein